MAPPNVQHQLERRSASGRSDAGRHRPALRRIIRRAALDDPGAGAVVMATGIVSLALALDHYRLLSRIWLAATVAAWIVLMVRVVALVLTRTGLIRAARSPASLTVVAATSVLAVGLRDAGLTTVPAVLLALGAATWVAASAILIRRPLPSAGTTFMITVAPASLAGGAAVLANQDRVSWLVYAALALAGLGVALYAVALHKFEAAQLRAGVGDHWVAGGALAITASTLAEISTACTADPALTPIAPTVGDLALAAWIAAFLWLVVLLAAELRWPRRRYAPRRWSTLFPVGMYAASGLQVASVAGFAPAGSFARAWIWFGVALWVGLVLGALAAMRSSDRQRVRSGRWPLRSSAPRRART